MDATYVPSSDPTIAQPGEGFYVTLRRGGRTAFLAGPFDTHAEALNIEQRTRDEACKADRDAHFDTIGTARVHSRRPGVLNARLGLAETPE